MTKRILGIDFGLKRIGIALSDPLNIFAQPLGKVIAGKSPEKSAEIVWNEIRLIMAKRHIEISLLVIGFPLTLKGIEKERAAQVRAFSSTLASISQLPVHHIDERLSSLQAERALQAGTMSRKERAKVVDEVSASILLQCYLDQQRNNNESTSSCHACT